MLTIPLALWRRDGRISSSKDSYQIEVEDFVDPEAGEPVWNMNAGTRRWMGEASYAEEAQRARKFRGKKSVMIA